MTEYGRGPGSEPWHPEDPLFGDNGWGGQADDGQSPYGGQPQQYPQQPQQQQHHQQQHQQYGEWAAGQQGGYGQDQQQYQGQGQFPAQSQQPYVDQGQQQYADQSQQQYGGQGQQPYGGQGQQPYADQGQQQQYVNQGQQQQYGGQGQQYDNSGWGNGAHQQVPYAADPADPYGGQPVAYGGEQPDQYGTPDAYPPPEPPARRRAEPEPKTDWDPGPDQGEHAFFAGGGDDDDDADDDDPKGRGGRGDKKGRGGGKGKKRRSGCACLVVVLVFGGGIGGVGYFGYQFYQDRFGAAPDYAGDGTGDSVNVTIPKGSGGYAIGQALKDAGVVKSVDAFVAAQSQNPKGNSIQAGVYTLKKEMSGESVVALMLSPASRNNLIIAEGKRNSEIYAMIDTRLEVKKGTTKGVAEKDWKSLGLPDWANTDKDIKDPLEGFLYPSSYPVSKGMEPKEVLEQMVDLAKEKYADYGLESKAAGLKLKNPLELLTVASLVQAEGKTHEDFRKMSEVIYNRLKPTNTETNQLLQFDSTFNYLKGQSKINISESEINSNQDPYNTYTQKGLPPGPIDNPGDDALKAALNPTGDGWIYFVATDGQNKTEFAKTYAEFKDLKEKFNDSSGS
ncbi:endolytic transglycosylase MltG [Streptomyces sp. NPDC087263]|uniref:endolytic transglycosylase MltG n=1 Tax=Streptomyces sp. NPDC087263 TaxID=3365773 RepID=UPI0038003736